MSTITPETALSLAGALHHLHWSENSLAALHESTDDAEVVRMATIYHEALESIRDTLTRVTFEYEASEIVWKQHDTVLRNLDWLKRHHPADPRIPQIEAALVLALPSRDQEQTR